MKNPIFLGFLMLPLALPAQHLLVANQKDHTLSVIDPATNKQIQAIDVHGVTGHEVIASPDGKTAIVPIYGSSGVGKPGTDGNSIDIIDIASGKIVHTIEFPHGVRPHMPLFDPTGRTLYVSTELDKAVTAIDPKTWKPIATLPTGQEQSHMFIVSHSGKRMYTANVGPGNVTVIDIPTRKIVTTIPISGNTQRISISNDDKWVFTSDQTKPQLAVIDTATNTIRQWVPLAGLGYGTAPTKDGKYLIITLRDKNKVAVLDLKTMAIVKTLDMPGAPQEVVVRPDGKMAYVSCLKQVAVIDTTSWTVPTSIEAGNGADGLAWAK
ncbi:40-residue YVTN family beta-propeller repeat-containing protein [Granulicella pectinivorans]|jgi:YVTN family beta-propeller protein|uniref:40-residue YVTN family beta-propeller repeat-containing protein n=1 Tax=Granulicella pectinivorans TaxID=474950 RepID=A0A1I6MYB5_9BACT|nr:cytochrome D1 domain-containing protein [Granulicella pectinivorans]SFS20637.1 40-residue YVTN family beta-propeller repeat-containing protein [Granulicella pectinivorans]